MRTKLSGSLVGAPLRGATPRSEHSRSVCAKRDPSSKSPTNVRLRTAARVAPRRGAPTTIPLGSRLSQTLLLPLLGSRLGEVLLLWGAFLALASVSFVAERTQTLLLRAEGPAALSPGQRPGSYGHHTTCALQGQLNNNAMGYAVALAGRNIYSVYVVPRVPSFR